MNGFPSPREKVLAVLSAAMPDGMLLSDAADLERYSRDWSGEYYGQPIVVARPHSVDELSQLMKCCYQHGIHVVPQGGLTGLVGGAIAAHPEGEVVVTLERMDKVRSINPLDFAMVVEAGCVLEQAKYHADQAGCLLPITFGAQGSCRIGGNVSTNAGGFNVLRYGMTRDLVLGLEVVLADGRIWNGLKTLRKDNSGYDLKQLFIGSEGTLGIVTAAALKIFPKPTQIETALVALPSIESAMQLYARARHGCADLLSAFELILQAGMDVAFNQNARNPLEQLYPVYVLIELASTGCIDLRTLIETFLEQSSDLVVDGVLAASRSQSDELWLLRELMVEWQGRGGRYLRTDVSVSISDIASFINDALAALAQSHPHALAVTYGHVGDGNIHLNVIPPHDMEPSLFDALFHEAEQVIFGIIDQYGGSISAEHGIGRLKQAAFLERTDPLTLELSRKIKDAFDPRHLLSEGRILASEVTS